MGATQSTNNSSVPISAPKERVPVDGENQGQPQQQNDNTPDYTIDPKTGMITCKCGYPCYDMTTYHHHAETTNSRKCPMQAPFDPSGWSSRTLNIIPYVSDMQKGVYANGAFQNGAGLVVTLIDNFDDNHVKSCLRDIPQLTSNLIEQFQLPVVSAVGLTHSIWTRWDSIPPSELKPFEDIYTNDKKTLLFPNNGGGDILLWVKCNKGDVCYELCRQFLLNLGRNVKHFHQTMTFKYGSGKDLTGFIDGTRNPDHLLRAIIDQVAIFPQDGPGDHTSGCYMYVGKFVHDMTTFVSMSNREKSEVIGRDYTKEEPHKRGYDRRIENPRLDEEEYMDEAPKKSPTEPAKTGYHTARGHGSMFRQAMPFVEGENQGLFFIAFARCLSEFDNALKRMAGHYQADGSTDNLFKITKAITSGYYYVPSLKELQNIQLLSEKVRDIPVTKVNPTPNKESDADTKTEIVNNGKPINVIFEYCTNCGYKTMFLHKKKVLETFGAPGQVRIIENPQIPRLAAFEIALEDGTVIFSKRALPDGMNNFPWCWPSDEELILKLRKYFGEQIEDEKIKAAEKQRNSPWGQAYWDDAFDNDDNVCVLNRNDNNNNNNNAQ